MKTLDHITNEDLIEFAKDQCEIFPEDSYMGKYLRETIKILERMLAESSDITMWISYEILLEKIKQAREEIAKYQSIHDSYCEHIEKGDYWEGHTPDHYKSSSGKATACDYFLQILDKLMEEEEMNL